MGAHNTTAAIHLTMLEIQKNFHTVLSFQHGDIMNAPEFENFEQISIHRSQSGSTNVQAIEIVGLER